MADLEPGELFDTSRQGVATPPTSPVPMDADETEQTPEHLAEQERTERAREKAIAEKHLGPVAEQLARNAPEHWARALRDNPALIPAYLNSSEYLRRLQTNTPTAPSVPVPGPSTPTPAITSSVSDTPPSTTLPPTATTASQQLPSVAAATAQQPLSYYAAVLTPGISETLEYVQRQAPGLTMLPSLSHLSNPGLTPPSLPVPATSAPETGPQPMETEGHNNHLGVNKLNMKTSGRLLYWTWWFVYWTWQWQ